MSKNFLVFKKDFFFSRKLGSSRKLRFVFFFFGIFEGIKDCGVFWFLGWWRCLGGDKEEEEAEVEERVVGGFREASSKAETSFEDPIHFLFPVTG
jgi:hypothetical protein